MRLLAQLESPWNMVLALGLSEKCHRLTIRRDVDANERVVVGMFDQGTYSPSTEGDSESLPRKSSILSKGTRTFASI